MQEKLLLPRLREGEIEVASAKNKFIGPPVGTAGPRDFSNSHALQPKAHRLIPGGAHTYAKGNDQYPEHAPGFIVRGKGCHAWDLDGNEFI